MSLLLGSWKFSLVLVFVSSFNLHWKSLRGLPSTERLSHSSTFQSDLALLNHQIGRTKRAAQAKWEVCDDEFCSSYSNF